MLALRNYLWNERFNYNLVEKVLGDGTGSSLGGVNPRTSADSYNPSSLDN